MKNPFKKGSQTEPGGSYPIANKVPYSTGNTPPLTGGDAYATQKVMDEMPYQLGDKNYESSVIDNNNNDSEIDDKFTPNLFGRWADVYKAWIGNWILTEAPDELKRLRLPMLHNLFMTDSFGLWQNPLDKTWKVGTISVSEADDLGQALKGTFIPYNSITLKPETKKEININKTNHTQFIKMNLGVFNVPLFVQIKYFIHHRTNILNYKDTNLRISTLQRLVGIKGQGRKAIKHQLNKIFNLKSNKIPSPVQILELGLDSSGKVNMPIEDLKNAIDISSPYKGLELLDDYNGVTTEIFRLCGLRTDLGKMSSSFTDRHTNAQTGQSTTYFDATENFILMAFENFTYDMKKRFSINVKWDCIYNVKKQDSMKESGTDSKANLIQGGKDEPKQL